jgi:hypothetical protein
MTEWVIHCVCLECEGEGVLSRYTQPDPNQSFVDCVESKCESCWGEGMMEHQSDDPLEDQIAEFTRREKEDFIYSIRQLKQFERKERE